MRIQRTCGRVLDPRLRGDDGNLLVIGIALLRRVVDVARKEANDHAIVVGLAE